MKNETAVSKIEIKLSRAQCELWNWAQSAAEDFWNDDEARDDGKHFDECPVSIAANGNATIANDADVIDDMIYRLNEQLPDMACEQGTMKPNGAADSERMQALRDIATANRIVDKLRSCFTKV
jgi:hypothetical protein